MQSRFHLGVREGSSTLVDPQEMGFPFAVPLCLLDATCMQLQNHALCLAANKSMHFIRIRLVPAGRDRIGQYSRTLILGFELGPADTGPS